MLSKCSDKNINILPWNNYVSMKYTRIFSYSANQLFIRAKQKHPECFSYSTDSNSNQLHETNIQYTPHGTKPHTTGTSLAAWYWFLRSS